MPNMNDFFLSRQKSKSKNGKCKNHGMRKKVAPGLGLGYTTGGSGFWI